MIVTKKKDSLRRVRVVLCLVSVDKINFADGKLLIFNIMRIFLISSGDQQVFTVYLSQVLDGLLGLIVGALNYLSC